MSWACGPEQGEVALLYVESRDRVMCRVIKLYYG